MTDPVGGEPGPDATLDDIQADIEATRHELGETVEALSAKLDVKQQVKQKVDDTKELIGSQVANAATDDDGVVRPVVPVAVAALLAVTVGILVWRRRR